MKKILITGANGFVGSALVRAMREDYHVIGVDLRMGDTVSVLWDFRDALPGSLLPSNVDIIIHAGALVGLSALYSADDYHCVNVRSCRQLGDYASVAGASQFIYLSTGGVYGMGNGPWTEDAPLAPTDVYSISKAQGELELHRLAEMMNLTIVRLFFPYGPGQSGRLIPNLAANIRSNRPARLNNPEGSPRINPVFITDVVVAVTGLIEQRFSGAINLAGPDMVTIRELAETIGRYLSKPVTFDVGDDPPFDLLGDITWLRTLLPNLQMTGLDQGLALALNVKADLT